MIAQHAELLRQCSIVGRNGSALAECAQVLAGIKAKATGDPQRSGFPALVFGAMRLARIFYHKQIVSLCNANDRIQISTLSVQVDWKDRLSSRRDCLLDQSRVHGKGNWVDVNKHGRGADCAHRFGCCNERIWDSDDFIASADS